MVTRWQSQCTECGWVVRGPSEEAVNQAAGRHRCGASPLERGTGLDKADAATPQNTGLTAFMARRHARNVPKDGYPTPDELYARTHRRRKRGGT